MTWLRVIEWTLARGESKATVERQHRTERSCADDRKRNKYELDGLKQVHATHLYLAEARTKWRDNQQSNTDAWL